MISVHNVITHLSFKFDLVSEVEKGNYINKQIQKVFGI